MIDLILGVFLLAVIILIIFNLWAIGRIAAYSWKTWRRK